jgi:hypothetical protein
MNNPYTPGSPLLDARMFFGRADELNEIGAFLNGSQSVSIVGPPKIGKTSLMRQLMQAESMPDAGIGVINLFVYIDCQAFSHFRKDEIFVHLCTAMAQALLGQGLEQEPALEAAAAKATWPAIEVGVRKLNQRGLRVVLMLDDFEQLTQNPLVDVSFYNALRSAAGRMRLVFLTGSARPLFSLTCFDNSQKILSSPFFNIFAQLFLGLLSESDARAMIRRPMEAVGMAVSPPLEEFIYQLAGGHPFALQAACSHAWEDPEDLKKIEKQTRQDLEPYFQQAWQDLSPTELEALCHPAEIGARAAGNPALRIALRDLTRKCLLVQKGETCEYPSKAWAEFVSAKHM